MLPLLVVGGLYALGWWRLSRRASRPVAPMRVGLALGGLACVTLALLSPLAALADRLLYRGLSLGARERLTVLDRSDA